MALPLEALRPGLLAAAETLSLPVSEAECDALLGHLALLQRWNTTYNLTSVRDPAQMLTQHLADCLAAVAPLRRELGSNAGRLLDVGSGGGLPGIVIAILNPECQVTCIDNVGKKTAFIQQVAGELKLRNLQAVHSRVEQLESEPFDIVTSRAFASLVNFTSLTRKHLAANGRWMAMKGKLPADELAALPAEIEVFHVEQLAVPGLGAERCLVWMRPNR